MNSMSGEKLKGIPYTGTLPAVLAGTKAGYLHRYKIYGNLTQNGTPTPSDPIYPSECGERTGNWFDADSTHQGYYNNSGNFVANNKYICSQPIIVNEQNYTISAVNSYTGGGYIFQLVYFDANDEYISLDSASLYGAGKKSLTGSVPSSATKIIAVVTSDSSECMLNSGTTALPYEPYGYKLPLLSGSTPVDIYLGESQTTRRIKKIKARDIAWNDGTSTGYRFYRGTLSIAKIAGIGTDTLISNKYKSSTTRNNMNDCEIASYNATTTLDIVVRDDRYSSASDWLLANGDTDIYYVLDTPETSVVNEPLRKIGDYADTIDSTQTTAQIPTSANSTTISWAGQGLAPLQFDSIQEWVNTPTYKRVNGEWVADNSN